MLIKYTSISKISDNWNKLPYRGGRSSLGARRTIMLISLSIWIALVQWSWFLNDLRADRPKFHQPLLVDVVSSGFTIDQKNSGTVSLTIQISPGWSISSTTQKLTNSGNGPRATRIKLKPNDNFRLVGPFTTKSKMHVTRLDDIFSGLDLETHSGTVTWQAPVEFKTGIDPEKITIEGIITCQIESRHTGTHRRLNFKSKYSESIDKAKKDLTTNPARSKVSVVSNYFVLTQGDRGYLEVTIKIEPGWQMYSLFQEEKYYGGPMPTEIVIEPSKHFQLKGPFSTDATFHAGRNAKLWPWLNIRQHEGTVTWQVPIRFVNGVDPRNIVIAGRLACHVHNSTDSQMDRLHIAARLK